MQSDKQPVNMKYGQRMKQDIILLPVPYFMEGERIAGQIFVTEHGPLGSPGGAGGIENCGQIIFGHFRNRVMRGVISGPYRKGIHGEVLDVMAFKNFRIADQQGRPGILNEIADFIGGIGRIQGQVDRANAQAGEIEAHRRHGFFHLY